VGVLGVQTDFAVVIDDLRMKRKDHVFFEDGVASRADDRVLDHGGADAVAGKMAERETVAGKMSGHGAVDIAGFFAFAHELAGDFKGFGITVGTFWRARTEFALVERPGEFARVAASSGDLEGIEEK